MMTGRDSLNRYIVGSDLRCTRSAIEGGAA
jgi:hypothetical protein